MGAEEFAEWQLMYEREGWNPQSARMRHAELLAATLQGQSRRKDGKTWSSAHFLGQDPWVPASEVKVNPRRVSVVDQVRLMNARKRRSA